MNNKPFTCGTCSKRFTTEEGRDMHVHDVHEMHAYDVNDTSPPPKEMTNEEAFSKNWKGKCDVCGESPTVMATGLCGPCTWGDSSTVGGNW